MEFSSGSSGSGLPTFPVPSQASLSSGPPSRGICWPLLPSPSSHSSSQPHSGQSGSSGGMQLDEELLLELEEGSLLELLLDEELEEELDDELLLEELLLEELLLEELKLLLDELEEELSSNEELELLLDELLEEELKADVKEEGFMLRIKFRKFQEKHFFRVFVVRKHFINIGKRISGKTGKVGKKN